MLNKNQIRSLYVWVHPGHMAVGQTAIDQWRSFIDHLQYEPRIALVETANTQGNAPWKESLKKDDYSHSEPKEIEHKQKVAELEEEAKEKLGDRYVVWPHGNFIEETKKHEDLLGEVLNVERRQLFPGRCNKMFVFAYAFGLKPDACANLQGHYLQRLAHEAGPLGMTAGGVGYANFFGLVEGLPSTKESLQLSIDKGHKRGSLPRSLEKLLENLPHANAEEAKGLIQSPFA